MSKNLNITLIFLLVLVTTMCKPANKTIKQDLITPEPFHLVAKHELGDRFTVEFNEDGRFVLCKSALQPDLSVSHYTVKFFVMDTKTEEILFRETIARGEVEWHDTHSVRISSIPGIIIPDAEIISNTYLLDIVTGKKITIGSTERY